MLLPEYRAFTNLRDSFRPNPESISEFHCRDPYPLATTDTAIHSLGGTGCSGDRPDGHQDDQWGECSKTGLGRTDDLLRISVLPKILALSKI
ncbi:hypothetical protein RA28_00520 [Ruegeria sp. ANG-S4]|nr:hypothetical protein RA28_00520 [Ruegeria sp. ANG-S4]